MIVDLHGGSRPELEQGHDDGEQREFQPSLLRASRVKARFKATWAGSKGSMEEMGKHAE
jgi:hypothetical protein